MIFFFSWLRCSNILCSWRMEGLAIWSAPPPPHQRWPCVYAYHWSLSFYLKTMAPSSLLLYNSETVIVIWVFTRIQFPISAMAAAYAGGQVFTIIPVFIQHFLKLYIMLNVFCHCVNSTSTASKNLVIDRLQIRPDPLYYSVDHYLIIELMIIIIHS